MWPAQHTGPRAVHSTLNEIISDDRMSKPAQVLNSFNPTWVNVQLEATTYQRKALFLLPRGVKREQLRKLVSPCASFRTRCTPTREETRTASLNCVRFVRRFAKFVSPCGKEHGQLRSTDPTRLRRFAPHFVPRGEFQNGLES